MIAFLLIIIRLINLFLIGNLIFYKRKEPSLLLAWILVLVFIPVIGFIFYLLFERTPKVSKKVNLVDTIEENVSDLHYESNVDEPIRSIMRYNRQFNQAKLTRYNDLTFYSEGELKYKQLYLDISQATTSIHFLYFIIRQDELGTEFVNLLAKKAHEGVEVRVIYDGAGCFGTPMHFFDPIIRAGGKVYNFHPAKIRLVGLNYNYRNHRKIVVIDGKIGYMGGMNIGKEYMSLDPKYSPWRDAHLRIIGESVRFLQLRFLRDYFMVCDDVEEENQIKTKFKNYFSSHRGEKECEMQIVSDGPDTSTDDIKSGMVKMIQTAMKSIQIQTPYFIPDNLFLETLKMAAYSGVKVEVMIPTIADHHYVYRTTTSFIKELREAGITVYLYKGFLHSKIMTVDGKVSCIGSTNMDQRSFKINYEISAFVYNETFTEQLNHQFNKDLENCLIVDDSYELNKRWWVRMEESIYRVISMIL
ncbi:MULTISPECIES: cardiolipin synthase [Turicibacter]|uniref:cardiolipin synthase n=1 Tax=Turicibacter TaxID=191303 RepID=UPI0006C3CBC9|nr:MULTISPECIES: cardiolipin synthase [Turicibacter]MBP3902923.1 cardiolipin synthase [Turicibacter sp.]MCU7190052.1 cardiolipin synthase [Turicibacter sanguinis]MCU7210872.1 cardiolipin synthase [Turicibacter sanguinis]MDB8437416.1 cardiolipin synthase [Turicibacter sanguinis]MDB8543878.1 cardiolipin synthase [Turicibacter sanguinis]